MNIQVDPPTHLHEEGIKLLTGSRDHLDQWFSMCGTRRYSRGYVKFVKKYILKN